MRTTIPYNLVNGYRNLFPDIDAMSVLERAETDYDSNGRPVTSRLIAGGGVQAVAQTSYDSRGRPECAAKRMNPGAFGSLPGACSLGAQGSFGPDRISRTIYNAASQVTQVQTAYGTLRRHRHRGDRKRYREGSGVLRGAVSFAFLPFVLEPTSDGWRCHGGRTELAGF